MESDKKSSCEKNIELLLKLQRTVKYDASIVYNNNNNNTCISHDRSSKEYVICFIVLIKSVMVIFIVLFMNNWLRDNLNIKRTKIG